MRKKLSQLFLLLPFLISFYGFGSNINTANLNYKCLESGIYELTLEVFTECEDNQNVLEDEKILAISYASKKLNINHSVIITQVSSSWIPLRCHSTAANTKCGANGTERGIYKHVYRDTLDLNPYNLTDDWVLSFAKNTRSTFDNYGINTENLPFYTSTILNTQVGCNNNPIINSNTISPMLKACIGMTEEFDLSIIDPDNDELVFRFETPKYTQSNSLTYKNGFSATAPITGSISVSDKGIISISANNLNEIGLTTLVIEEWRNGSKIGETKKDIQIETFDCSNEPPTLSKLDNGTTSIQICELDTLNAFLLKSDPDIGDQTSFFIDSTSAGAPTSIFQAATGTFSGVMLSEYVGTHVYKIGVKDDDCPFPLSVYRTFIIDIIPLPSFDLGITDTLKECNIGKIYNPVVTGKAPFSYLWEWRTKVTENEFILIDGDSVSTDTLPRETLSIDSSITLQSLDTATIKYIYLTVIDDIGCTSIDSVFLIGSVIAEFDAITRCIGDDTDYKNNSTVTHGTITDYSWDFGFNNIDKNQNTLKDPIVLYPSTGEYSVQLTVTNSFGCTDTDSQTVIICNHPKNVAYIQETQCSLEAYEGQGGTSFLDITKYDSIPCGLEFLSAVAYDLDSAKVLDSITYSQPIDNPFFYEFPKAGNYKLTMYTITEAKCIDEYSTEFLIYQRPTLHMIQENFSLNCSLPDTTLSVVLDTVEIGNGGLIYSWSPHKDSLDLNYHFVDTSLTQGSVNDSSWVNIDTISNYYIKVIDTVGCSHRVGLSVGHPVEAKFKYSQVCELGDTMTFTEIATKKAFKVVERIWDFGDGTKQTIIGDTMTVVKHVYEKPQDYVVFLRMIDSVGCTGATARLVYNSFPINRFEIDPVLAEAGAFCKEGALLGLGNYPDSSLTTTHIDTITWKWNDNAYIYSNETNVEKGHLPLEQGYEITDKLIDADLDSLKVSYTIEYNRHPEMDILTTCKRSPEGFAVRVREKIEGSAIVGGNCTGDSLTGEFTATSKSKIIEWNWQLKKFGTDENVFESSSDSIFTYYVPDSLINTTIAVYIEVKNEEGCIRPLTFEDLETIKKVQPVTLSFTEDTLCLGSTTQVSAFETNVTTDVSLDRFVLYNITTKDTLIGDDENEFINFKPQGLNNNFINNQDQNILFLQEGPNIISLYLADVNIEAGQYTSCGTYTYDTIMVYPAPKLDFAYTPVCAGNTVTLVNNTTIELDSITDYIWTLPDENTSNEYSPSFSVDKGGFHNVSLEVKTVQNCTKGGANKIDTTIYFHYTPIANFIIDSDELEAYIDLPFESTSTVEGNDAFINDSLSTWNLGDNTIKTGESIIHNYNEIGVYPVTHSVVSNKGCHANISKNINLNTFLNVPNGFSPNGDGKNDAFSLIHKEISEIYEYKIYNRWGELVFDGGSDPNATWNGKFRGVDQEIGVYILYVKGTGAYGVEYNIKENITLIR